MSAQPPVFCGRFSALKETNSKHLVRLYSRLGGTMNEQVTWRMRILRGIIRAMALGMFPGLAGLIGAADIRPAIRQFPLEAAFINQAVGAPFDGTILDILHPGFSMGTEYVWKDARWGRLIQGIGAGYYFNKYDSKAVFLQTSFGYRVSLGFGLFGEVAPVLGYLRYFHPTDIWRLNAEGEYEKAKDRGRGALMISGELGLGFDFSRKLGWPVAIFLRYQPYIMSPDTPDEGTKWQAMLQAGIRVHIW
jgi:hypothetical protein